MGVREMLDEIRSETLNEAKSKIEEAKKKADSIVTAKIEELEALYAEKMRQLENELLILEKKLKGKRDVELLRNEELKRVKLYNSFYDELVEDVIKEIKSDKDRYLKFLISLLEKAKEKIDEENINVSLSYEDEALFEELMKMFKWIKRQPPIKIKGGVVCFTKNNYVDASFDHIFSELRPEIIKLILKYVGE